MNLKKIVVMLAEGFEEIEALTVVDVLRRANVECDLVSISGKEVLGAHDILVTADKVMDEAELNSYDGVVLPGGMPGAANLKNNIRVVELIKEFSAVGKIVAAICAAPIVLEKAGIIGGKKITSYPSFDIHLGNCIYSEDVVVRDNNIITSRGPATTLPFSFEILEALGLEEEAKELKESMMFNKLTNM